MVMRERRHVIHNVGVSLSAAASAVMIWLLLVDPRWKGSGPASPISQWQIYGTFELHEACESNRDAYIAQLARDPEAKLKARSACVPNTLFHSQSAVPGS